MPSDDYTSAIGGGLKLKGSKPSGITKTKKKKKDKLKSVGEAGEASAASSSTEITKPESENATKSRKAEVSDDVEADELLSLEEEAYGGKTETERKHEEMKRKRVSPSVEILFAHLYFFQNSLFRIQLYSVK
jgi:protein FAM32A